MQSGNIYKHHRNWMLRYYDVQLDGSKKRKAVKLARISPEFPTKSSVYLLAQKYLIPINSQQLQPESNLTVCRFIEDFYWPFIDQNLKPATGKNYRNFYRYHLKEKLGDIRLREFRTVSCQNILDTLTGLNHTSKLRVKSLLSGIFSYALQRGFIDGQNPVTNAVVRGRPVVFKREIYTMTEIQTILEALKDIQASAAVSIAAFAGLRVGEIAGLKWADYDGKYLYIRRSVWRTHIDVPKTESSCAAVPVIDVLRDIIDQYRQSLKEPSWTDFMFSGPKKKRPLNLYNLTRRVIRPSLRKYEKEIQEGIIWRGWHSFRAGLASNLYSCEVDAGTIQNILRHVDVSTTMRHYVSVPKNESVNALQKISEWYKNL